MITCMFFSGKPADLSPRGSDDDDDELLFQREAILGERVTGSRRSSLASDDEPELKEACDTRKQTATILEHKL